MHATQIEIGRQVRLFAPMLAEHGGTGTVVQVHRDPSGEVVTAKVAIDGSPESRWLHRASLTPIDGDSEPRSRHRSADPTWLLDPAEVAE